MRRTFGEDHADGAFAGTRHADKNNIGFRFHGTCYIWLIRRGCYHLLMVRLNHEWWKNRDNAVRPTGPLSAPALA
jgi:hypothetical protein